MALHFASELNDRAQAVLDASAKEAEQSLTKLKAAKLGAKGKEGKKGGGDLTAAADAMAMFKPFAED